MTSRGADCGRSLLCTNKESLPLMVCAWSRRWESFIPVHDGFLEAVASSTVLRQTFGLLDTTLVEGQRLAQMIFFKIGLTHGAIALTVDIPFP